MRHNSIPVLLRGFLLITAESAAVSGTLYSSQTLVPDGNFRKWSLNEALAILTNSPWAKQETYTRVGGGVGSGVSGEKEIYSTFFVRFLSARPVREAFARVTQIQGEYDRLSEEEKGNSMYAWSGDSRPPFTGGSC